MQNNNLIIKSQSPPGHPINPCRSAQQSGQGFRGERLRDPLLYLYSNNSDENENNEDKKAPQLSSYQKKQAHCTKENCQKFIEKTGIERVAFLTLTFGDDVKDNKEASRRFNNLNRRFISEYFGDWALVKERQKNLRWHYHLLIDCLLDIRTGFDFETFKWDCLLREQNYKLGFPYSKIKDEVEALQKIWMQSAPAGLKKLWPLLNNSRKKNGFGRCNLIPIYSNAEAAAYYAAKYASSHNQNRPEIDKGVRLSSYSSKFARSTPKFQWRTPGSKEWREKVKQFAHKAGCFDLYDISRKLGSKWSYIYKDIIMDIENYTPEAIIAFIERYNPDVLKNHKIYKTRILDQGMEVIGSDLIDKDTGEVLF